MGVAEFGWTDERAAQFGPWAGQGLVPGRVVKQARDLAVVVTDEGEIQAEGVWSGSVGPQETRQASPLSATGWRHGWCPMAGR